MTLTPVFVTPLTGSTVTVGPQLDIQWHREPDAIRTRCVLTDSSDTSIVYLDTGWSLLRFFISVGVSPGDAGLLLPLPTDTSGLAMKATVSMDDGSTIGSASTVFDIHWGVPSCTVTSPPTGAVVTTEALTVGWSYSDSLSGPQGAYRVLLGTGHGGTLYDTGWVDGAGTSATIDYTLIDGVSYDLGVRVRNANGVESAPSGVLFTVNQSDPVSAIDDNTEVGTKYHVAINGVGYPLMIDPTSDDGQVQWVMTGLEANKLYSQGADFDERIDHYQIVGNVDWTGGAGQKRLDRPRSDTSAFADSEGIDPFTAGELTLLHATPHVLTSAYSNPKAAVAAGKLYMLTSAVQLTELTAPSGGTTTNIALTAAQVATDVTTDGQYWYVAHGGASNGIARGNHTATLGWSAIVGEVLWYAGQRVCVGRIGSGSTPNIFTTLDDAGAEEVGGGRLILPAGWTITKGTEGSGHVFFGAYASDRAYVYRWTAGSSDAPAVAWPVPRGQIPVSMEWYEGELFVRTRRATKAGGAQAVIWRCPVDSAGNLTPVLLCVIGEDSTTADWSPGGFAVNDRYVFFADPNRTRASAGARCLDLGTGGYANWLRSGVAASDVVSLFVWNGRLGFTVAGSGAWHEADTYVTSGWLQGSLGDRGSLRAKVVDTVSVVCDALTSTETVTVEYSTDGTVWAAAASMVGLGQVAKTATLGKKVHAFAFKTTITADGSKTPRVTGLSHQLHALDLSDAVAVLRIDCRDDVSGPDGTPFYDNGPGAGVKRARALEALAQSRVKFQDIDWPVTGVSQVWELLQVKSMLVPTYDDKLGYATVGGSCQVTLRRNTK